jgi:hypothetical protein
MKPELVNKNIIYNYIDKKKSIIKNINNDKNILMFNFLIILLFIIFFLFLLFRYLDKDKNKKNIS